MLRWRQRKSATEALGGPKGAWSCSSSPKGRGLDAPARSVSAPDGRYGGGEGAEESMPEKHCMALRIAELGRRCIGIPSSRAGLGVAWPQPSTTAVQPLKKGPEGVSVRPRSMSTRDLCGQLAPCSSALASGPTCRVDSARKIDPALAREPKGIPFIFPLPLGLIILTPEH